METNDNDNALRLGQPECALIARLQLQVEVRSVTAGIYEFLSALSEGRTVGEAMGVVRRMRRTSISLNVLTH